MGNRYPHDTAALGAAAIPAPRPSPGRTGCTRPRHTSRTARPASRRRLTAIVILAILVLAAVGLTIALSSGKTAHTGSAPGNGSKGNSSLQAAAAARKQAATWVTAQVSPSATVACDPVMCSALQIAGFPAGNLLAMSPDAGDPLGSAIVMSTEAIRSTLGSRLTSVYAPVVLASFGNQTARVDVRVTAPDGARAYLIQLHRTCSHGRKSAESC